MTIKEFWITNISNKNVMLADLNVTIIAHKCLNLLGKHSKLTVEDINKSIVSGSLFKKRDKIKIRHSAPLTNKEIIKDDKKSIIPNRTKSTHFTKEETFEELSLSDEKFAEENADFNE